MVIRSILAAAVFMVFLSISGGSAGVNIVVVAAMFVLLLGFGWVFDNWFYRYRLRRWERKRAG